MIGTIEIKCFAANPQKPLSPVFTFKGSPSSLRILDVPRKIGNWAITAVKVCVSYPDNSIAVSNAVRTGNVWVATFTGCGVSGKTANGIQILADGIDENGDAVTGYVLGVGDLYILERDSSIAADDEKWYVRYCEETPATPAIGDLIIDNGSVKMFDGEEWVVIAADLSTYATKQELNTAIQGVRQDIPTKTSELQNDSGFVDTTALNTALATKQDKLSIAQVSAIDSVVDERTSVVSYNDGSTLVFNIEGAWTGRIPNAENAVTIKIGEGVTSLENSVFFECTNLTSVALPNSLSAIADGVFYGCTSLASVHFGTGLKTIGNGAFQGCTSLTAVDFPEGLTTLAGADLYGCTSLATVTIPASVSAIGPMQFIGCTALSDVVFKGRTLTDVQALQHYPWAAPTTVFRTENVATKEWVEADYVKAAVMTESEYGQITPQADVVYFVTEDSNA